VRTGAGHAAAALLLPVIIAIGGCGPSPVATQAAGASASPVVATQAAGASPSPLVAPPTSTTPVDGSSPATTVPAPSGSAASGVTVDAGLLPVLPSQIDGVPLQPDPATAEQIAADPTLAGSAQAIAVAFAIRPGTSSGDDLAIVSVIRLRPGVFSDSWFETWRSTYDQGACAVAGGVKGAPSQTSIAGRTVYVGTCAGDARTYHVRLADPSLIVSITAAGPARFGELVVAGLVE